jgi:hypothetical protein
LETPVRQSSRNEIDRTPVDQGQVDRKPVDCGSRDIPDGLSLSDRAGTKVDVSGTPKFVAG